MNIWEPLTSRRPDSPIAALLRCWSTTQISMPAAGQPSLVADLREALVGSVSVAPNASVIPHNEHGITPNSRVARSISADAIGAPAHKIVRMLLGRGAPALTASQTSSKNAGGTVVKVVA